MVKFSIPAEEAIATYELVFLLLFAVGMMSFVNWVVMQYPYVGITLAAFGVLLLWLARMIRKKRDKNIAKAAAAVPVV